MILFMKKKIKSLLQNIKYFFSGKYFKETKEKKAKYASVLNELLSLENNELFYTKDEISKYSRQLHRIDNEEYNRSQNSLCFVVIGGIVLIIGIIFIFLSLLKRRNIIVGINFLSLQFFICVISLVVGSICLIYGIVKFIKTFKTRKQIHTKINILGNLKTK